MRASKSSRASKRAASAAAAAAGAVATNPDEVRPATRDETFPIALAAVLLSFVALLLSFSRGYLLLYGDAVPISASRVAFWTRVILDLSSWVGSGCRCLIC